MSRRVVNTSKTPKQRKQRTSSVSENSSSNSLNTPSDPLVFSASAIDLCSYRSNTNPKRRNRSSNPTSLSFFWHFPSSIICNPLQFAAAFWIVFLDFLEIKSLLIWILSTLFSIFNSFTLKLLYIILLFKNTISLGCNDYFDRSIVCKTLFELFFSQGTFF